MNSTPTRQNVVIVADMRSRCVLCHAILRRGHSIGDLVCDSHIRRTAYNPRCDGDFDRRVLRLLIEAYPRPLNLLRALGTDDRWAVRDCVRRWRRRGIAVSGVMGVGYVLGEKAKA